MMIQHRSSSEVLEHASYFIFLMLNKLHSSNYNIHSVCVCLGLCIIFQIFIDVSLQPLPQLSRIPGLVLAGNTFSDCLMLLQFLHSFGKVLGLDSNPDTLTIGDLQEGLLNLGNGMEKVQDLLVSMLSAAVCDPGVPAGHKVSVIVVTPVYMQHTRPPTCY